MAARDAYPDLLPVFDAMERQAGGPQAQFLADVNRNLWLAELIFRWGRATLNDPRCVPDRGCSGLTNFFTRAAQAEIARWQVLPFIDQSIEAWNGLGTFRTRITPAEAAQLQMEVGPELPRGGAEPAVVTFARMVAGRGSLPQMLNPQQAVFTGATLIPAQAAPSMATAAALTRVTSSPALVATVAAPALEAAILQPERAGPGAFLLVAMLAILVFVFGIGR